MCFQSPGNRQTQAMHAALVTTCSSKFGRVLKRSFDQITNILILVAFMDVVDLSDDDGEMEQWIAQVKEVCPFASLEDISKLLLDTRDPVNAIHRILDRH